MRRIDLGGAASFAVSSGLPEIAEVFVVEEMDAADVVDDEKHGNETDHQGQFVNKRDQCQHSIIIFYAI